MTIATLARSLQQAIANQLHLVAVHGHALRVPAELAVGTRADGSAARVTTADSTALLERKKLLGAEALVVDLRCRLDQVLQVGAGEEVAEVDKFAVVLVLNYLTMLVYWTYLVRSVECLTVDDAPAVLSAAYLLATDHDGLL